MPDIGLLELLVIGVLLFVVVGPERMPEFFGQVGRWVRHGRNWWSKMHGEISREIEQNTVPFKDVAGEMHENYTGLKQDVEKSVHKLADIEDASLARPDSQIDKERNGHE
jgi:sec-independent protein translocase protein TatB